MDRRELLQSISAAVCSGALPELDDVHSISAGREPAAFVIYFNHSIPIVHQIQLIKHWKETFKGTALDKPVVILDNGARLEVIYLEDEEVNKGVSVINSITS